MGGDSLFSRGRKMRVLFICTGNTCRSVLAEHIARKKFGEYIDVASAGVSPGSINDAANAIFTLKSLFGIDAGGHRPADVRTVGVGSYDIVVAMDNEVMRQVRTIFPDLAVEHFVEWKIEDPYGDNLVEYQNCAATVNKELKKLEVFWSRQ
jgi:protein-tyrosine-phosphatase